MSPFQLVPERVAGDLTVNACLVLQGHHCRARHVPPLPLRQRRAAGGGPKRDLLRKRDVSQGRCGIFARAAVPEQTASESF